MREATAQSQDAAGVVGANCRGQLAREKVPVFLACRFKARKVVGPEGSSNPGRNTSAQAMLTPQIGVLGSQRRLSR